MIRLLRLTPYTGDMVAPSPNHGARRALAIQGIVLHATADEGDEALALQWMRSPRSRVSCHLMVSRGGQVTRLVGDQQRAWHAGVSWWRGTSDVNSVTLGIEIANRNDGEPYTDAQYFRVAEIVAHYCRQGLSLDDVVSHQEVAEGRRTDPFGWDWDRFRAMVQQRLRPVNDVPLLAAAPTPPLLPRGKTVPDAPRVPARVVAATPPRASAVATPKPAVRSRTLWLNGMTVLASGGLLTGDAIDLAHRVGMTLPPNAVKWALFIVGLINILFRLRTNQPVACTQNARNTPVAPPRVQFADERPPLRLKERRLVSRKPASVVRSA